jgi:hypothetical protein
VEQNVAVDVMDVIVFVLDVLELVKQDVLEIV